MKYTDEMICFQEVPNEVTLSFSISNCPHKCPGCHSSYLAQDIGVPLLPILRERLNYYKGLITCVLFMGGDDPVQNPILLECLKICKEYGLKTALYSGAEAIDGRDEPWLDYLKIGPYIEEKGPLTSSETNQRMYKKRSDGSWENITSLFWKRKGENKK